MLERSQETCIESRKRGQEPIVRSTRWAIWLLVPDPFFEPKPGIFLVVSFQLAVVRNTAKQFQSRCRLPAEEYQFYSPTLLGSILHL